MTIEELTYRIIGSAYKVHTELGPGLLEKVYEAAMLIQLKEDGLSAISQVRFPVFYHKQPLEADVRLDLLVEDTVIVELKSVEELTSLHHKQLLSYLKIAGKPVGLLINFNVDNLKDGIRRKLYNYYPESD